MGMARLHQWWSRFGGPLVGGRAVVGPRVGVAHGRSRHGRQSRMMGPVAEAGGRTGGVASARGTNRIAMLE